MLRNTIVMPSIEMTTTPFANAFAIANDCDPPSWSHTRGCRAPQPNVRLLHLPFTLDSRRCRLNPTLPSRRKSVRRARLAPNPARQSPATDCRVVPSAPAADYRAMSGPRTHEASGCELRRPVVVLADKSPANAPPRVDKWTCSRWSSFYRAQVAPWRGPFRPPVRPLRAHFSLAPRTLWLAACSR